MRYHLAILSKGWIELILDGTKTIESRFTKVRCAPFGKVHAGDIVFMKESGGLVKGAFLVEKVETFENLTLEQISEIDAEHHERIFATPSHVGFTAHWDQWLSSKHATLIHIAETLEYNTPFALRKRDPRAWVVYDQITDFTKTFQDANLRESVEDIFSPNSEILSFLES